VSLEGPGANFRTLQVLEDAKGAPFALGGTAEALDVTSVIFVSAVGKIEAGDVHAQAKQVAHVRLGVTGRTDRANDFRAARSRSNCELWRRWRDGCLWKRLRLFVFQAGYQIFPDRAVVDI
jgi:hypothetical protein